MAGNGWLAYSPALHLLRESGTTIGLLDLLDERKLRPGEAAVLAGLLNLYWASPLHAIAHLGALSSSHRCSRGCCSTAGTRRCLIGR
jgi:hypothetical protein